MNNRTTIALLVLFFTGLLGLKWAEYAKIPDRNERLRAEPRVLPELINTKPDELKRVEIRRDSGRLVFERRADHRWQMIEPLDVAADPSIVETLAFNLKELTKARDVGRMDGNPLAYGLETSAATITLWGAELSQPLAVLDVGSVIQEMRYVRSKASGRIDVVDAKGIAAVDLPAARWRDRSLSRIATSQVHSLAITGSGRSFKVEREAELWRIVDPIKALGDLNRIDGVVAEVVSLKVADREKGFVADNVKDFAPFGLDTPTLTFSITPEPNTGTTQIFHLGKPAPSENGPRYYARRDDQDDVVLVDATLLKDLGAKPLDLHSKKVADVIPDRVDYVRLTTTGSAAVAVVKKGTDWSRVAPLADKADTKSIDEMLKKLDEIEASELFLPGQAPDPQLETPWAILEVWQGAKLDADQRPTSPPRLKLKIGRRDVLRKTAFCQTEGDTTVLAIPSPFLDMIPGGSLAFRDRQVVSVRPVDLEQVVIKESGTSYTIVPPPNGITSSKWRLKEPTEAPADPESLGRLLTVLINLRAETLVTDQPVSDAKYGLDKPFLTVSWTTRDETPASPLRIIPGSTTTLAVGGLVPQKAGVRFARVSTSPIVFTLPPETIATLDTEWRDRLVMELDLKQVRQVSFQWPSITLTAKPSADSKTREPDWSLVDPPTGLTFDTAKIKPLMNAVSKLTAVRYSQYDGPIEPKAGLFPPRLSIVVAMKDGPTRTLSIGRPSADGYLLATTETLPGGAVFQLPLSSWEPWLKAPSVNSASVTPKAK